MNPLEHRKQDHLRLCLEGEVQMPHARNGFDRYAFVPQALPELNLAEVQTQVTFLGRTFSAPILISSMTGGNAAAGAINRNLAEAAQRVGVPLALGSQRIVHEAPEALSSFKVRDVAPEVFLLGNLGAVQLNHGFGLEECKRLVESIQADALFLHLNALQEAVQPEGDTDFGGLTGKIATVAHGLGKPVLVKEVGCGIAPDTARRLVGSGVSAIDVAGAGGTSWARIEGQRAPGAQALGELFADWGLPTSEALRLCRAELPDFPLIASGGIRNGLEIAKALALGADMVGLAHPFLEAATISADAVVVVLERLIRELKVTMFLVGFQTLRQLHQSDRLRALVP